MFNGILSRIGSIEGRVTKDNVPRIVQAWIGTAPALAPAVFSFLFAGSQALPYCGGAATTNAS